MSNNRAQDRTSDVLEVMLLMGVMLHPIFFKKWTLYFPKHLQVLVTASRLWSPFQRRVHGSQCHLGSCWCYSTSGEPTLVTLLVLLLLLPTHGCLEISQNQRFFSPKTDHVAYYCHYKLATSLGIQMGIFPSPSWRWQGLKLGPSAYKSLPPVYFMVLFWMLPILSP